MLTGVPDRTLTGSTQPRARQKKRPCWEKGIVALLWGPHAWRRARMAMARSLLCEASDERRSFSDFPTANPSAECTEENPPPNNLPRKEKLAHAGWISPDSSANPAGTNCCEANFIAYWVKVPGGEKGLSGFTAKLGLFQS